MSIRGGRVLRAYSLIYRGERTLLPVRLVSFPVVGETLFHPRRCRRKRIHACGTTKLLEEGSPSADVAERFVLLSESARLAADAIPTTPAALSHNDTIARRCNVRVTASLSTLFRPLSTIHKEKAAARHSRQAAARSLNRRPHATSRVGRPVRESSLMRPTPAPHSCRRAHRNQSHDRSRLRHGRRHRRQGHREAGQPGTRVPP